jgi:hypothetical protein
MEPKGRDAMTKPAKQPHNNRTVPFMIKLTDEERAAFETAASRVGLSVSAWIRMQCLDAVRATR